MSRSLHPVPRIDLASFVAAIGASPLSPWLALAPREITAQSGAVVRRLLETIAASEFAISAEVAGGRRAAPHGVPLASSALWWATARGSARTP